MTATYPDRRSAQQAVEALGWRGVEGSDVTIDSPAADRDLTMEETRAADEMIANRTFGHAAIGFATGVIAGTLGGAILGAIINLALEGDVLGWSFYVCLVAGALFGVIVGTVVGGATSLQAQREFEVTETPGSEGETRVGVHRDDARDIERTERVLRSRGPTDVRREDAAGRPE